MTFKVLTNDVGPNRYSMLTSIVAPSIERAMRKAQKKYADIPVDPDRRDQTLRILILKSNQLHLHDGQTGVIKPELQAQVIELRP